MELTNIYIESQLLALQEAISFESTFLANGQRDFSMLGMSIEGMGNVPFPLTENVAKQIISIAAQAPYGKGHETLVDTKVRNTWEIEPSKISFGNKNLAGHIAKIIIDIQEQLGIEHLQIDANFYKLLVYEKGSFFLKHKDSEKEKGMFGTLVVTLPSSYEGGEFVIEFDGTAKKMEHTQKEECINWLAFYADCDHEILPITDGYRLALVYNLISTHSNPKPFENKKGLEKAMQVLQQHEFENLDKPIAMYLQHQYTETNFSLDLLKGTDLSCATILLESAKHLGWYANIGLIEHQIIGMPDGGDYYGREIDAETAIMDEVFDESDTITAWCLQPSLGDINIDELLQINKIDYDAEEPIEKESDGYMGNYGPELTFTYRNSVVILAPPKALPFLLSNLQFAEQLEWINYYMTNDADDIPKIEKMYRQLNWENKYNRELNYDGVYKLWIAKKNIFLLDAKANEKFATAICFADAKWIATFL